MNNGRTSANQEILEAFQSRRMEFFEDIEGYDIYPECNPECASMMSDCISYHMCDFGLLSPEPESPFSGLDYSSLYYVSSYETPAWKEPFEFTGDRCQFHNWHCYDFGGFFLDLFAEIDGLELSRYVA